MFYVMGTLFDDLCYDFACANNFSCICSLCSFAHASYCVPILGAEINMSISSDEDASQDESGTDEDFMVAYIALELMGSTSSVAKNKEVVPNVPVMTGI